MMDRLTRSLPLALLASLGLAACSGSDNGSSAPPPVVVTPPPVVVTPPAPLQSRFGGTVSTSFAASPNSDAREPAAGDVPPLSFTTDPFDN